jgi:hypothetical protein
MARLTTFVFVTLLLIQTVTSTRIHADESFQDQINEVTTLIVDLIDNGSFVRLFPFCKQTDPVFEWLMHNLVHAKQLVIVIGEKSFLYPLQTTI